LIEPPFCRAQDLLKQIPLVDLHIHTRFTDGHLSIAEVVQLAHQRGLGTIVFSDHARRESDYIPEYVSQIDVMAARYRDLKVLKGVEVKIINLSGDVDLHEAIAPSIDLVIGVIHRYPIDRYEAVFARTHELAPNRAIDLECEASLAMFRHRKVQVLGHPGRTFVECYKMPVPDSAIRQIVTEAARQGVAVELNARAPNLAQVLRLCLEVNSLVSLGSDSHSAAEVGTIIRLVQSMMQEYIHVNSTPENTGGPSGFK
jgi:histidinol phosphatase-like PHP family hydrolase